MQFSLIHCSNAIKYTVCLNKRIKNRRLRSMFDAFRAHSMWAIHTNYNAIIISTSKALCTNSHVKRTTVKCSCRSPLNGINTNYPCLQFTHTQWITDSVMAWAYVLCDRYKWKLYHRKIIMASTNQHSLNALELNTMLCFRIISL